MLVNFAKCDRLKPASTFQAEREAANAREQVEDFELVHLLPFPALRSSLASFAAVMAIAVFSAMM